MTLRYGDHPEQVVDLRLPPAGRAGAYRGGAHPPPLVVVIHGGFWRAEFDRAHTGPLAADLAARGLPVAQLEYRRTGQPGGGWPGTFADVAAGLMLLPALVAERCSVADGPPLLVGHSAGGHLALWWAARAPVRGVVALAPVTDLRQAYELDLDTGAVAALLGGGPEEVPHRYAYARPGLPDGAPVTVVHGTADRQVPCGMSRQFAAATGVDLVELPGVEHFGLIDPESTAWPGVLRAVGSRADPGAPAARAAPPGDGVGSTIDAASAAGYNGDVQPDRRRSP